MRRHLTSTLAAAVLGVAALCAGCAANPDADALDAAQARGSQPLASNDPSAAYWATVEDVQDKVDAILETDIGVDFRERIGGQDTAVALSTVAESELRWQLDAPFALNDAPTTRERTLVDAAADPASIGDSTPDSTRDKAFLRFGSEEARDHARDMCRVLTEGTHADFVVAIADASDAARTDLGSPAAAGAGLAPVICPEFTDEYLAALTDLSRAG